MNTIASAARDTAFATLEAAYDTLKTAEADRRTRRITHDEMVEASLVYDAALEACHSASARASQLLAD